MVASPRAGAHRPASAAATPVRDAWRRPLGSLRLSVIDQCNLRCQYCMPEREYTWLPGGDLLSVPEMARLVDAFVRTGVDRVRITGGEPLLRKELPDLVGQLADRPGIADLALTTNGVLLARMLPALVEAGLHRVTVSLDTLDPGRFQALTRRTSHAAVLSGIEAVRAAGLPGLKLDTVVIRGVNDDELVDLIAYGCRVGAEVRFIEYMDVGGATGWTPQAVVPGTEILATLAAHYGQPRPLPHPSAAPARRYALPDGTTFGVIASTTTPFCADCDRSRVTADGIWLRCLYAASGTDLRTPLRAGASVPDLAEMLAEGWRGRTDRGAVERLRSRTSQPLLDIRQLRADPHLEMHTRGG